MMDERYGDRTVVFATHVMEEVRRIADYVAFLADGKLLGLFEKDALLEGWRTFWLDREPEGDVPGMVEVESGNRAVARRASSAIRPGRPKKRSVPGTYGSSAVGRWIWRRYSRT